MDDPCVPVEAKFCSMARVLVRPAGVNDYRQIHVDGYLQLAFEGGALAAAIGVIVVVVQADFADGDDPLVLRLAPDRLLHRRVEMLRLVGMYPLVAPTRGPPWVSSSTRSRLSGETAMVTMRAIPTAAPCCSIVAARAVSSSSPGDNGFR